MNSQAKSSFGARSPGSPFFQSFLNQHFKVSKNSKKIIDVYNDIFYSSAKFQPKPVCISSYTKKMTNPHKTENFEFDTIHQFRTRNLSFLHSSKYRIFCIGFLHIDRNNHSFQNLFELINITCIFFLQKRASWCPCSKTLHSNSQAPTRFLEKKVTRLDNSWQTMVKHIYMASQINHQT